MRILLDQPLLLGCRDITQFLLGFATERDSLVMQHAVLLLGPHPLPRFAPAVLRLGARPLPRFAPFLKLLRGNLNPFRRGFGLKLLPTSANRALIARGGAAEGLAAAKAYVTLMWGIIIGLLG